MYRQKYKSTESFRIESIHGRKGFKYKYFQITIKKHNKKKVYKRGRGKLFE